MSTDSADKPQHTAKCLAHGWDILHDVTSSDPDEAKC